jgi:anti-anti-sigma factor
VSLLDLAAVADGGDVVVHLSGEADLSTVGELADGLRAAAALGSGAVLLDVAALRFCDCSALRVVASFVAEVRSAGRGSRLLSASGAVRRLIELAGFADLLDTSAVSATIS